MFKKTQLYLIYDSVHNITMKAIKWLLFITVMATTGCELPVEEISGLESAKIVGSDPSPEPEPDPDPAPEAKSLLSSWTRTDNYYSVDLSELTNQDTGSGIITLGERALFVFTPTVTCSAIVEINGTEDNGEIVIRSSLSITGSPTINSVYCDPLEGTYLYYAQSGGGYHIDFYGVNYYWQ